MARQQASVREGVPLSRFGILVAQLESIAKSGNQQPPDPLLCFDLLSDLVSAVDEEPKAILLSLVYSSCSRLKLVVEI
ncbi:unnamed protein product [Victoria cruziana]